jgi:macrolide-specific efflux system membrane fusion protein
MTGLRNRWERTVAGGARLSGSVRLAADGRIDRIPTVASDATSRERAMSPRTFIRRVRTRTWVIAGAAVAVLVAAAVVLAVVLPSTQAEAQTITRTATASLETLEQTVDASGTLTPLVDEDVDFDVSGTVTKVAVDAGDVVTKGDTLAKVGTLELKAAVLEAESQLAQAEAALADAEDAADGSSSSDAQIDADQAAVEVAEAAVDDAEDAVDGATLVAPVSGTVTAVNLDVGDTVSGGSTSGGSESGGSTGTDTATTAAFTIVGTDAWSVDVTVSEADMALIGVDDQVELTTDDDVAFFGTVSEIGMLPDTSSGTAAYPVTVAVTGTEDGLYDGIAVTASIVYERRTDVLTVPSAAVTTDGDTSTVTLVAEDGTQTETTVTVGETVGDLTEITDGIAEGDEVLVASFTPGEGNTGTTGGLPMPGDGQMPGFGGEMPSGGFGEAPGAGATTGGN